MPELPDLEVFKRYVDSFIEEHELGLDLLDLDFSAFRERLVGRRQGLPDSILLPHRREGADCLRGNAKIQKTKAAGRTAYYCPAQSLTGFLGGAWDPGTIVGGADDERAAVVVSHRSSV